LAHPLQLTPTVKLEPEILEHWLLLISLVMICPAESVNVQQPIGSLSVADSALRPVLFGAVFLAAFIAVFVPAFVDRFFEPVWTFDFALAPFFSLAILCLLYLHF
jgi:hypothetical protein